MKYAVQMGSGAMIYIPSFINIGSGIQKLIGWGIHRQTGWRSYKPASMFSKQGKEANTKQFYNINCMA
jgi:hypothetical protein